MVTNGHKMSQIVPNVPKWSQMVLNCHKWSQIIPNRSILFQMVPNKHRGTLCVLFKRTLDVIRTRGQNMSEQRSEIWKTSIVYKRSGEKIKPKKIESSSHKRSYAYNLARRSSRISHRRYYTYKLARRSSIHYIGEDLLKMKSPGHLSNLQVVFNAPCGPVLHWSVWWWSREHLLWLTQEQ